MAFKIVWSVQARDDLQSIILYIAQDNPAAAESFGYLLISKIDVLEQMPEIGRVVPERGNRTIRELIFRSYRIIYKFQVEEKLVAIVRLWHGARGEPDIPDKLAY